MIVEPTFRERIEAAIEALECGNSDDALVILEYTLLKCNRIDDVATRLDHLRIDYKDLRSKVVAMMALLEKFDG